MSQSIVLEDEVAVSDLEQFLSRAKRLDKDGAVRLRSYGDVLTVTVAPIYGTSILGNDPTILGMRVMKLAKTESVDVVVSLSSMLDRLAIKDELIHLPPSREVVSWAGISPPQQGWLQIGELDPVEIQSIAEAGISEVANAVPGNLGASLVQRVRSDVWGRKFGEQLLPSGVCFALSGLGFLVSDEKVRVFQNGNWRRLTTDFGHVLTKTT
ncbi:MAG: hypothetical protein RIS51_731 [Actinomycetota bacterium]